MRLWASVVVLCKQKPTHEIYVNIRKTFLENSEVACVVQIPSIISPHFALYQSNSPVRVLLFLEWVASRASPPIETSSVPLCATHVTELNSVQWIS